MTRSSLLFFLLGLLSNFPIHAQADTAKTEFSVFLVSGEQETSINFNHKELVNYTQGTLGVLDSLFSDWPEKQDIFIILTLSKSRDPVYTIHAYPQLSGEQQQYISDALHQQEPIRSKHFDYFLEFFVSANGGSGEEDPLFLPPAYNPLDRQSEKFKAFSLEEKRDHIQNWALESAHLIASHAVAADEKFVGVNAFGSFVLSIPAAKAFNLTGDVDKNPDYWRAMVEMAPGNLLIPTLKILLHTARGQFDYARAYLDIMIPFSDEKNLAYYIAETLNNKLNLFYKDLHIKINKGIELHDMTQYQKAIDHYQTIIEQYPASAWGQYEMYYSMASLAIEKDSTANIRAIWDLRSPFIFYANPLYPMRAHANSREEAYDLYLRQQINQLFTTKGNFVEDVIQYADIALDLEQYDFAAFLYWMVFSHVKEEAYAPRKMINYFLYALDQLGNESMKENFQGNFKKVFRKIRKERRQIKKDNVLYQRMKK